MKTISIIIPFYNEERTISTILDRVLSVDLLGIGYFKQIILVNDGSRDDSELKIQKFLNKKDSTNDVTYIKNNKNYGKGYSIKKGLDVASGDLMIIQDADMEYDPDNYVDLIKKLEENRLDFVYGSRIRGFIKYGNHYVNLLSLLGNIGLSIIVSILNRVLVTDKWTCYKLFTKKLKKYLLLPKENGFEWESAITMMLLRKGFKYGEVAISYRPRKVLEGKKITWIDGIRAISTLIKWRFKKMY